MKQNVISTCALTLGIAGGLGFQQGDVLAQGAAAAGQQQAVSAESEQRELSDREIRLAVENELLASEAVKSHRIRVGVEGAIVTLAGRVRNLLAEDIAVGLTQRVRGVQSVVDQLEVNPVNRDDKELQADVVAALAADQGTKHVTVTVVVEDGTARLTGDVTSNGMKTLVGNVVRSVNGVREIDDQLKTDSKAIVTDADLKREIQELLQYSVQLDQVQLDVGVKAGTVVLNGLVTTDSQRSFAEQQAWRAGAKDVDVRGVVIDWRHANPELRTARYEKVTDEQIRDAILRGLKYDPRVLSFEPEVHVHHGVVTLTGVVGHLAAKRAAERTARFTVGVHRVNNVLNVNWPDSSPTDEEIAEYTIAAIRRDPYLTSEEIVVDCENAHVSLHGIVENNFEKQHAEWTASCQKGIVHVDNYLTVRAKWVPRTDAEIAARLKDQLDLLFVNDEENQVTAKVSNGVALMEGSVETWFLWQTALDAAITSGAREPHMMIEVRNGTPASLHYAGPHAFVPQ
jgi:osmotically-inducible protein OsmY